MPTTPVHVHSSTMGWAEATLPSHSSPTAYVQSPKLRLHHLTKEYVGQPPKLCCSDTIRTITYPAPAPPPPPPRTLLALGPFLKLIFHRECTIETLKCLCQRDQMGSLTIVPAKNASQNTPPLCTQRAIELENPSHTICIKQTGTRTAGRLVFHCLPHSSLLCLKTYTSSRKTPFKKQWTQNSLELLYSTTTPKHVYYSLMQLGSPFPTTTPSSSPKAAARSRVPS